MCEQKQGKGSDETVRKLELLMKKAGVTPAERKVVAPALQRAEQTGAPAAAMELPDGTIVTGKTSDLLGASSALLLNALKKLAGMRDSLHLISPVVLDPIQHLKVDHLRQPQSPSPHRRDADRPVHLRRHQPHGGTGHGAAGQAAGLRGTFLGDLVPGGRKDLQASGRQPDLRAEI